MCWKPCDDEHGNYEEIEVSLGAVISRCRHPLQERDLFITYRPKTANVITMIFLSIISLPEIL